jgi:IMP dehydrogenase
MKDGHLVGIITNRDLRFETRFDDSGLGSDDETAARHRFPVGTTLEQAKAVLQKHRIEKLLVVDDDKHIKGLITCQRHSESDQVSVAAKDNLGRLRVAAAIGATGDYRERADELVKARVRLSRNRHRARHSSRVIEA